MGLRYTPVSIYSLFIHRVRMKSREIIGDFLRFFFGRCYCVFIYFSTAFSISLYIYINIKSFALIFKNFFTANTDIQVLRCHFFVLIKFFRQQCHQQCKPNFRIDENLMKRLFCCCCSYPSPLYCHAESENTLPLLMLTGIRTGTAEVQSGQQQVVYPYTDD